MVYIAESFCWSVVCALVNLVPALANLVNVHAIVNAVVVVVSLAAAKVVAIVNVNVVAIVAS